MVKTPVEYIITRNYLHMIPLTCKTNMLVTLNVTVGLVYPADTYVY